VAVVITTDLSHNGIIQAETGSGATTNSLYLNPYGGYVGINIPNTTALAQPLEVNGNAQVDTNLIVKFNTQAISYSWTSNYPYATNIFFATNGLNAATFNHGLVDSNGLATVVWVYNLGVFSATYLGASGGGILP